MNPSTGLQTILRSALALSALALAACGTSGSGQSAAPSSGEAPQAEAPGQAGAPVQVAQAAVPQGDGPVVTVYKTPTCGCCAKWVDHMKENGFRVDVHDMADVGPKKREHGVPGHLESCHTAIVGGYTLEGHVPASTVKRLLSEKPRVAGVAVPNMPVGSPGMEMGGRKDPYDVMAFTKDGQATVYESH